MRRITVAVAACLAGGLALALAQNPPADEEKAVREAIDSYTAAFEKGNLDGLMAHFTPDADYINESGKEYKGKADLTELFKRSLADLKGYKLKAAVTSLHFLRPDVVIADGKAIITAPDGTADSGRFTSTWTKTDGKWLVSSVHDLPDSPAASESPSAQLKQLEWLLGDWASEDPKFQVQLSGRWALNKSFLLLEYTVKSKDSEDLTVVQYFGWDPVEGVIRSWFLDSQGGYGGGDWERQGNTWTSDWSGVLSEGQIASSTNTVKFIDDKSFLFRSIDRELDGMPMPDVEAKFVRKSAAK